MARRAQFMTSTTLIDPVADDGAFILVVSQGEATGLDVSLVSTGDGKVQPLLSSRFDEGSATFSPPLPFSALSSLPSSSVPSSRMVRSAVKSVSKTSSK